MTVPDRAYRCFHCKQIFLGDVAAESHFGRQTNEKPKCWMYPPDMREIADEREAFRNFTVNILNGLDTGLIRIETDADETLANVLAAGRALLPNGDHAEEVK